MRTVVYKNYDRDDEKTEFVVQKQDELNYWRYGREERDHLAAEIESAWREKLEEEFEEKIEEIERSISSGEKFVGYRDDGRFTTGPSYRYSQTPGLGLRKHHHTMFLYDETYILQIGFDNNSPKITFSS